MSIRSGIAAIFRFIVLTIAWIAVIVAGLYVLIANPLGTWGIARIAEWQVTERTDITLRIGSFNTDYVSYLKLTNTHVAFPNDTTRISIDRLNARYSIIDLIRGDLGGIGRVQIDSLDMAFRIGGGESDSSGDPFVWSIQSYLPFVPERVAVDGLRLALISENGVTAFAVPHALITTVASAEDSSLTGDISITAEVPGVGAASTIPLTADAHVLLRGPTLRADHLTVNGPGVDLNATADIANLVRGPYASQFNLNLDLAGLPSDIAGFDLVGTATAAGDVTWSDTPEIDLAIRSDAITTPWVNADDVQIDAATDSDGRIVIDGASGLLDGALTLDAVFALFATDRTYSASLDIANADLEAIARIPGLAESLASSEPRGTIFVTARTQGALGRPSGGVVPMESVDFEVTARDLVVADVSYGDAMITAHTRGADVDVRAEVIGVVAELTGAMPRVNDVDLTAQVLVDALDETLRAFDVWGVGGALDIDAHVTGALSAPTAELHAAYTDPILPGVHIADFHLDAILDRADELRATLGTVDSLIIGSVLIADGLTVLDDLQLAIGPWRVTNLPGNLQESVGLDGSFSVDVVGSGPLSAPRISAKLRTTEMTSREASLGSFVANVDYSTDAIAFDMQNDLNTLDITGTVSPTGAALSSIAVQWQAFEFGAILAAFTGHPVEEVAGISEGSINVTWRDPIAETLRIAARVEQVEVDLIGTTYKLANPPARFDYADGAILLEPVLLTGDGQTLRVHGSLARDGAVDFSMVMDDLSIANLARISAGDDIGARGTVEYAINLGGTLMHPVADGFFRAEDIRWKSFAVDSVGAQLTLASDTLSIPDLHAKFPFGRLDGSFMATLNALGVPVPSKIDPAFHIDLVFDRIGAEIDHWEGLRSGQIGLSGAFNLTGTKLADLETYRGMFRLDSLSVDAPFDRSVKLLEPFTLQIANDIDNPLSNPVHLAQILGADTVGTIVVEYKPNSESLGLDFTVERLRLADLRHLILPLVNLPDDLDGELSVNASWNAKTGQPHARLAARLIAPIGYGVQADSIRFVAAIDPENAVIEEGYLFSSADTLHIEGGVSFADETLGIRVRANRFEAVNVALPSLPPIDEIVPPAPSPRAAPLPGTTQHIQYLPSSMSGEDITKAHVVFDRVIDEGTGRRPENDLAATIPVDLDIRIEGPTASPKFDGFVRLRGAYLDLRMLDQPVWFTDPLEIPLGGDAIAIDDFVITIGGSDQIRLRRIAYSLDDGAFDFDVGLDRVRFGIINSGRVVLPKYLRPFGFALKPLLEAYYADRIGTFTLDSDIRWHGTPTASSLRGNVAFYNSVLQARVPEPQDLLVPHPSAGGGGGGGSEFMPGVDILINFTTPDSIAINNNVSNNASIGFTLQFTGIDEAPRLQGRVDVSEGSTFRYLGREFVVNQGTLLFSDPDSFTPDIDLQATSTFLGVEEQTNYRVEITVSGTFPDLIRTEFVAYAGTGASEEVIVDQRQVITLLIFGTTEVQLQAQGRLNRFLANQGFAAASAALGSMVPLDQVAIQQRETETGGVESGTVTELQVAETFRVFGQQVRVSVSTPVNEISTLGYQRAEARWYILQRPEQWRNLESLSLTVGNETASRDDVRQIVEKDEEWNTDIQVRIRF